MTLRTTGLLGAAVLAVAGTASGQWDISYTNGTTALNSINTIDFDGQGPLVWQNFPPSQFITGGQYLQETRTVHQNTFSLDTTNYPSINSLDTSVSIAGQAAPDRFEFSWDTSSTASFADTIDPNGDLLVRPLGERGAVYMEFTEDVRIRVSYSFSVSGQVGEDLFGGGMDHYGYVEFIGDAVPNDFSAGYGTDVDLTSGFSVELDVAEGSELEVLWRVQNDVVASALQSGGLRNWDQRSSGSIVIEVVPAPASASLMVLGGLVAGRRRR